MKILFKVLFLITILMSVASCDREVGMHGDVPSGIFFSQVIVQSQKNNVLRYNITVELLHSGTIWAECWQEDDTTRIQSSKVEGEKGTIQLVLMMIESSTRYKMVIRAEGGDMRTISDTYEFTTGNLPSSLTDYPVYVDEYKVPGYIFTSLRMQDPGKLILFNTRGKIVWYQDVPSNLSATNFDTTSQTFTCYAGGSLEDFFTSNEIFTIDLYGKYTFRKSREELGGLLIHHDARLMPNGNYIIINFVKKSYDLSTYGGSTSENVTGDGYTILDDNGKVLYQWDCFRELNPMEDPSIMGNTILGKRRDDWLHANAIEICPDGNIIMSFNFISQIWKINSKDGKVLWRIGKGGNIPIEEENMQNFNHTCTITKGGDLLFYDNMGGGGMDESAHSRIISYNIDDLNRTAKLTNLIKLSSENSSFNQSSVYEIATDKFLYGSTVSRSIGVVDKTGKILWRVVAPHQFFRAQHIKEIKL